MKDRILVIDDESSIRKALKMILEYAGYDYYEAADGSEGLKMIYDVEPDLIFLDIKMPIMDGMDVLKELYDKKSEIPVVMISGHGTIQTAVEATKLGAYNFIEKPLDKDRILLVTRNALKQRGLEEENIELKKIVDRDYKIVGESAALKDIMKQIKKIAPTDSTVLIRGESGTGKELIGREIHRLSQRADKTFIQVNCAAIPEELIESELFGHEKGSFTGAVSKQVGKFQQADGGTIFLDEVGDMSLKTQAKVLRVLQDGELERIGSNKPIKVDVRVISATNKDLEEEIEKDNFREDLFFRLNVIPIHLPALRERKDDIPMLIDYFTDKYVKKNNFKPIKFSPDAMDVLKNHLWRGNIRELQNTVERLAVMNQGQDEITRSDLPADLLSAANNIPQIEGDINTLKDFKEVAEKNFILQKLRENNFNVSKTAEVIGTPRSNLYKKLEQYEIDVKAEKFRDNQAG
ncbi:MAG: sigma-54-dependent Fis family transcriptional regulator [Acidobacteria bacterium]|nr:sigma-54-dependent Fis family transcriptional regulator [Acidobacteriota bacterium]